MLRQMHQGFGVSAAELPGCARLELAEGVVPLNPREAVFEGMLAGWARQQRSRFLREEATIGPRAALVRRLAGFAGQYPWEWEPAEAEAFISHLRSGARPVAVSTARGYETALRLFCEYVTDPRYEWAEVCERRFGRRPVQVFHEWNSVAHVTEYGGAAGRRPLTYDKVQALFHAADGRVEQIRARGRKGALAALRDAAVLKTRTLGVVDDVEPVDVFLQLFEGGGDGLLVEPAEQGLVEALVLAPRGRLVGLAGDRLDAERGDVGDELPDNTASGRVQRDPVVAEQPLRTPCAAMAFFTTAIAPSAVSPDATWEATA
jgi:hypothetical protein